MTTGTLRNFLCATAAAACCAVGTPASAIVWNVGFDPDLFAGIVTIDVAPGCHIFVPGTNPCDFEVLAVDFTDSTGFEWKIGGPQPGVGQLIALDALDALIGIQVQIIGLQPVRGDRRCIDGESLSFDLKGNVIFQCGGHPDDFGNVTYFERVPEPATLALLGLGLLGLAASRRRARN